ncbi:MAG: hypothetical protein FWD92_01295 [Methanomassiliicoccaceae archaeon]|nr:hypothetical protein [Methanomassiliicoccaceae archaeon]
MTSDEDFIPSAIAATVSGSLPSMNAEDANSLFSEMLHHVAVDCVNAGSWMIGHIKANVRSGDDFLSISVTTDNGNVRSRAAFTEIVNNYSMTVNVIVYGLERKKVAEILVSNLRKILADVDITVHSQVGCEDPGCGDPLCQDENHKRIIPVE